MFSLLIIACVAVFFLLVPGLGAFAVRAKWRKFRHNLVESINYPLYDPSLHSLESGSPRNYRFFGILEGVEGNDRLWVRGALCSVSVEVKKNVLFFLPAQTPQDFKELGKNSLQALRWENAGVLSEGLNVIVSGRLRTERGHPVFYREPDAPLTVLLFDGTARNILSRALWYGRQTNEYWNDVTPLSLLSGSAALLILSVLALRGGASLTEGLWASLFAFLPYLVLMPPGIFLFFLYRSLWRKGRTLRAYREVLSLGEKIMRSEALRESGDYVKSKCAFDEAAKASSGGLLKLPLLAHEKQDPMAILYEARSARDPMAESFLVQGKPLTRLDALHWGVRFRETGGIAVFLLGLGMNFYLLLLLLVQVLNYR